MTYSILQGDCLAVLKTLPDNSVDSVVTDPPYGISFMNKKWDHDVPSIDVWRECLRVLKPGGHMLVACGTRTQHRMVAPIEDAGFEIRDVITWLYGCYSADTECLTRRGWVNYKDLTVQDEVLQWESGTGTLSWTHPKEIIIAPYKGQMVHFKNRHTDQMLTPNHRVYGKFRKHARNPASTTFEVIEAADVKGHWQTDLPTAGVLEGVVVFDPKLAYLVGWWLTDAWVHGDGKAAMFSQSKPLTLARLKQALDDAECTYSEYVRAGKQETHQDEHTLYVRGPLADYLLSEWKDRRLTRDVINWTKEARLALLTGLMDGDGSTKDDQHARVFWTKDTERQELVQLLAATLGYRTLLDEKKGAVHFNPKTDTTQIQSKHRQELKDYDDDVWCLRVDTGAFMVRRNGHVFISGNSGFPKSLNISKAIDKEAGAVREVVGPGRRHTSRAFGIEEGDPTFGTYSGGVPPITAPATDAAKQWEGFGTAIKPAVEFWTLCRKPLSESTVAKNVLKHGTGGLNVDGCRVETPDVLKGMERTSNNAPMSGYVTTNRAAYVPSDSGRFPANLILDEEAAAALDEQTGILKSGSMNPRFSKSMGFYGADGYLVPAIEASEGGASRFFYCAKSSKSDRGEGNVHPTCKPTSLMAYLCKLITPPGGLVLDPFAGSGSTGVGALREGFSFAGIEREAEYVTIVESRLSQIKEAR